LIDEESIQTVKHFFTDKEIRLSRERYGALLMMLMDGTAHDEEIDEDIREEATSQIKDFVVAYLKPEDEKPKQRKRKTKEELNETGQSVPGRGD
jgi:hypothetical protein